MVCVMKRMKTMIDKTEIMNEYLDWYDVLLTSRQREICNMYYKEDYSLSEISENCEISRSAVLDTVKRCEKLFVDYEEKLQLVKKYHARSEIYGKMKAIDNREINELANNLEEID